MIPQPWGGELANLFGFGGMAFGGLGLWLLGRHDRRGWAVGLVGDAFWLAATLDSGHLSFLLNDLVYTAIRIRGWYKWRNQ